MANEKRLIDANALKKLILRRSGNMQHSWTSNAVLLAVECQPTVDAVEVVNGRWVNAAGGRTICNHCGEYPLYDYFGRQKFSYYCPNCGADMRERKDDA